MTLKGFSQKPMLNDKDTVICFTIPQSKFLLKKYYQAEELFVLDSICEAQLSTLKLVNSSNESIIKKQSIMVKNKEEETRLKELEISSLNELISDKEKEIKKQKTQKWGFITLGVALITLLIIQ